MTNIYNEQFYGYESVEFNLATGQTDYSLVTNQSSPTGNFNTYFGNGNVANASGGREATRAFIRTNQTLGVRVNSASNNSITIASTDSPFEITGIKITDLFFTNGSGSTSAVKVLLTDNPN